MPSTSHARRIVELALRYLDAGEPGLAAEALERAAEEARKVAGMARVQRPDDAVTPAIRRAMREG